MKERGLLMSEVPVEKWSTMKDVQAHLGVRRETVLHWINLRRMPAYKIGRIWKFKLSEVDDWVRNGGAAETTTDKESKKE